MAQDPVWGLEKLRTRVTEKADKYGKAARQKMVRGALVFLAALFAAQPAAAQSGGDLNQLVGLLNGLADLMQRVGLALAVLGFSAAGIAYLLSKPALAKRIAQNTIIGTVMLLLSGAAVDYLAGAF